MSKGTLYQHIKQMASAVKQDFYRQYEQAAIEQQIKYGIPASITLAQMALESGSGTSSLSQEYNNYFGMKKGSSWTGPTVNKVDDHSYAEPFRVYRNVGESIEDHSRLLMKPIYQKRCQGLSSTDYIGWANGIGRTYASDAEYAQKLIGDIQEYHLDAIDKKAYQLAQQRGWKIGYMRGNTSSSSSINYSSKAQLTPLQGNWALPIDLSKVKVTGEYGEQRSTHFHGGIDLSTQGEYLPVVATEDNGKVVKVGNQAKGAGNYVTVEYDRPDGTKIQTTYMHLSRINVEAGNTVNAGQQIAISGNTGRSTGPHLHFETKFLNANGEWQKFDPTKYLAEMEIRSGQNIALDHKGKDYLASARNSMEIGSQQGASSIQDPTQALLASITGSNDPTKWLSALMTNNNDLTSDRDPISELISSMFSAAMALAIQIRTSEEVEAEMQASAEAKQSTPEEESTLVKMSREDVAKAQSTASMQFDSESPEQQQTNGQRLA